MSDDTGQLDLPLYVAPARRTDPETSHEAREDAAPHASRGRRLVLIMLLLHGGLTDYELAELTGWQQNSIGKRRGELMAGGLVRASRREDGSLVKRPAPSGSKCIVWEITEKGRTWTPE